MARTLRFTAVLSLTMSLALACTPKEGKEGTETNGPGDPTSADSSPGEAPTSDQVPWPRVESSVNAKEPLRAGFLIVDGVYNSELMAPYDIFHHTPFHTKPNPGMEVFTVSPDGKTVTTFEGLLITPHHSFETAPPIDILVVPSAEHSMTTDLENQEMMNWVAQVGANADYILSLCDGAFVLAKAGLLEDRVVTTFPGDQDRFAEMFPHIDLRRETGFVHDGNAITSEGGAKSYDPAMYLVDHIYGTEVAKGVAKGLIITWPPIESDATISVPTP